MCSCAPHAPPGGPGRSVALHAFLFPPSKKLRLEAAEAAAAAATETACTPRPRCPRRKPAARPSPRTCWGRRTPSASPPTPSCRTRVSHLSSKCWDGEPGRAGAEAGRRPPLHSSRPVLAPHVKGPLIFLGAEPQLGSSVFAKPLFSEKTLGVCEAFAVFLWPGMPWWPGGIGSWGSCGCLSPPPHPRGCILAARAPCTERRAAWAAPPLCGSGSSSAAAQMSPSRVRGSAVLQPSALPGCPGHEGLGERYSALPLLPPSSLQRPVHHVVPPSAVTEDYLRSFRPYHTAEELRMSSLPPIALDPATAAAYYHPSYLAHHPFPHPAFR